MTMKRWIATALVTSLVAGFVPVKAFASTEDGSAVAGSSVTRPAEPASPVAVDLRLAAHKAVADAVKARTHDRRDNAMYNDGRRENDNDNSGGGGGGGGAMVATMTIVSLVMSAALGYFMYKQLKKSTNSSSSSGQ